MYTLAICPLVSRHGVMISRLSFASPHNFQNTKQNKASSFSPDLSQLTQSLPTANLPLARDNDPFTPL